MKTLKSIDGKSLLIGGLLVAIMFIGVAAQEAPKKVVEQQWEYVWAAGEGTRAISTGETIADRGKVTPVQKRGLERVDRLVQASRYNWAAQQGWEVDPSGITGTFFGTHYTLMRRPKK